MMNMLALFLLAGWVVQSTHAWLPKSQDQQTDDIHDYRPDYHPEYDPVWMAGPAQACLPVQPFNIRIQQPKSGQRSCMDIGFLGLFCEDMNVTIARGTCHVTNDAFRVTIESTVSINGGFVNMATVEANGPNTMTLKSDMGDKFDNIVDMPDFPIKERGKDIMTIVLVDKMIGIKINILDGNGKCHGGIEVRKAFLNNPDNQVCFEGCGTAYSITVGVSTIDRYNWSTHNLNTDSHTTCQVDIIANEMDMGGIGELLADPVTRDPAQISHPKDDTAEKSDGGGGENNVTDGGRSGARDGTVVSIYVVGYVTLILLIV